MLSALALEVAGVTREAIVADYAPRASAWSCILRRLRASPTYRDDLDSRPADDHMPRPRYIEQFLRVLDDRFGGPQGVARAHGWTADAQAAIACPPARVTQPVRTGRPARVLSRSGAEPARVGGSAGSAPGDPLGGGQRAASITASASRRALPRSTGGGAPVAQRRRHVAVEVEVGAGLGGDGAASSSVAERRPTAPRRSSPNPGRQRRQPARSRSSCTSRPCLTYAPARRAPGSGARAGPSTAPTHRCERAPPAWVSAMKVSSSAATPGAAYVALGSRPRRPGPAAAAPGRPDGCRGRRADRRPPRRRPPPASRPWAPAATARTATPAASPGPAPPRRAAGGPSGSRRPSAGSGTRSA